MYISSHFTFAYSAASHTCLPACIDHDDDSPCSCRPPARYWSMWNIAHNLGGFSAPLIAGGFANAMGWQWGMWAPGIIGMGVGAAVFMAW